MGVSLSDYNESALIEQPAIAPMIELDCSPVNAYHQLLPRLISVDMNVSGLGIEVPEEASAI